MNTQTSKVRWTTSEFETLALLMVDNVVNGKVDTKNVFEDAKDILTGRSFNSIDRQAYVLGLAASNQILKIQFNSKGTRATYQKHRDLLREVGVQVGGTDGDWVCKAKSISRGKSGIGGGSSDRNGSTVKINLIPSVQEVLSTQPVENLVNNNDGTVSYTQGGINHIRVSKSKIA